MISQNHYFSKKVENWLSGSTAKTVDELSKVFGEKSFAVAFFLLMAIPALPLPTGGISHVFEIISMLLALEMSFGLNSIWVPKFIRNKPLRQTTINKAVPFIIRRIRWFEQYSKPRLGGLLNNKLSTMVLGLVIFGLALGAFLAPPFTGMDTLPALGVVMIALGIILDDSVGVILGVFVGLAGIAIIIGLGTAIANLFF